MAISLISQSPVFLRTANTQGLADGLFVDSTSIRIKLNEVIPVVNDAALRNANESISGAWSFSSSITLPYLSNGIFFQAQRITGFPPVTTNPTFQLVPGSSGTLSLVASSDWFSGMAIYVGDVGTEINLNHYGTFYPRGDFSHFGTNFGVFGTTPVAQQTGGALTAGAAYGANEQTMLNSLWTALRNLGFIN